MYLVLPLLFLSLFFLCFQSRLGFIFNNMQHLLFSCTNEDVSSDYDAVSCSEFHYHDILRHHLFLCERHWDAKILLAPFLLVKLFYQHTYFYTKVSWVHLSRWLLIVMSMYFQSALDGYLFFLGTYLCNKKIILWGLCQLVVELNYSIILDETLGSIFH